MSIIPNLQNDLEPANDAQAHSGLGIRARLFFGFGVIVFTFLISALISIYFLLDMRYYTEDFKKVEIPIALHLVDIENNVFVTQTLLQNIIFLNKDDNRDKIQQIWDTNDNLIADVEKAATHTDDKTFNVKWTNIKNTLSQLQRLQKNIITLYYAGKNDEAMQFYKTEVLPLREKIIEEFHSDKISNKPQSGVLNDRFDYIENGISILASDIRLILLSTICLLAFSVILSIIISLVTAKKILKPLEYSINIARKIASGKRDLKVSIISKDETASLLKSLNSMQESIKESEKRLKEKAIETKNLFDSIVKSANLYSAQTSRVAGGDLTKRLDIDSGDNNEVMVKLGKDLNRMTDNLASIAGEITNSCLHMVSTLDEVRHSVDAQSSGATEQASSINEITASISEIEKSASQTMAKAKTLGEVATKTREKGQMGLDAVEQSIVGMKAVRDKVQIIAQTILDLSRQTQQVGEITVVVNTLAQQSKMLALNASIEAAKAGEAGKGFAVVANEVKNLAEQSEQSTSQVQKILEDIKQATEKAVMVTEEGTKGVDTGMVLIEQTGNVIRGLNDVIHETSIATQQIEAAIRQESSGIEQINAGMNEINQVTAAFVESSQETSEAMDNLAKITQNLKTSVEIYKV